MVFRKAIVKCKLVFSIVLLELLISSVATNAFSQTHCRRALDASKFQNQSKLILAKLPFLNLPEKYFKLEENLNTVGKYVEVRREISEHILKLSTTESIENYVDFLYQLLSTKNGLRLVDLDLFHSESNKIKEMQSTGSLGDISILSLNLVKPIIDRRSEMKPKDLDSYLASFRKMISRKEMKDSKESNREARLKIIPAILVALDGNEIRKIHKFIAEGKVSESALSNGSSSITNPSFIYAIENLTKINRDWLLAQIPYFKTRLRRTNETDPKRVGEFLWGILHQKELGELSASIPSMISAKELGQLIDSFPVQMLREGSRRGKYSYAKVLELSRLLRLYLLELFEENSFIQIYGSLPNRKARYVLDSYDAKSLVELSDIDLVPSVGLSKRLKTFFSFNEEKIEIELPYKYSFKDTALEANVAEKYRLFENANKQVLAVLNPKMDPDINVLSLKATLEYISKEDLYLADSNPFRIQIDKSGVYFIVTHPRKLTHSKHRVIF